MKILLKLMPVLILITAIEVQAQTFTFVRTSPQYVNGHQDSAAIISNGIVNNLTGSSFLITFRRTTTNIPPQWEIAICTWVLCYTPGVDSITENCPPGPQSFKVYFYPWGYQGTGTTTIVAKRFTNPSENYSQTFGATTSPIGIKQISSVVKDFSLNQNYPNPFNPTTRISFSIPTKESVYLRVYDILGREVKTLISQDLSPGEYEYEFEADNMSSGFYYYSLRAGENVSVKKMVLVK